MKFGLEKREGVVLILLKGSLEGGPDTFQIKDEVKAQVGKGERRFVLDMTEAAFVNSTGIGVIVSCLCSIMEAGGELKLCGLAERPRRALAITGVLSLFQVHDGCEAALRSFETA